MEKEAGPPQGPLFPTLVLQGCGSKNDTLCSGCVAPWDLRISLQLILSVPKRHSLP